MSQFSNGLSMATLVFGLVATSAAIAQVHDMHGHTGHNVPAPAVAKDALSTGEVKKVDKEAGLLTVQHGPLANLNMPGMTMAFKVQDPSMLDQVKTGDKIRLRVEYINDAFTVTKLELAR